MKEVKKTSYQSEYHKTHYRTFGAMLDIELVNEIKAKLKEDNVSVASFIKNAIEEYLKSNTQ